MLNRMVRGQLIAFVVVTLLGVTYAGVEYLRVPRMLGAGIYTVTLQLPSASGLYEHALVTYRGIEVGKVDRVELDRAGVTAVLGINDGVSIPANSAVSVRGTSAIGEQFVNFEPGGPAAPPLRDGDVIPAGRVGLPTAVGKLLSSVNDVAATLPLDKLHSTVDELYRPCTGRGRSSPACSGPRCGCRAWQAPTSTRPSGCSPTWCRCWPPSSGSDPRSGRSPVTWPP